MSQNTVENEDNDYQEKYDYYNFNGNYDFMTGIFLQPNVLYNVPGELANPAEPVTPWKLRTRQLSPAEKEIKRTEDEQFMRAYEAKKALIEAQQAALKKQRPKPKPSKKLG